MTTRIALPNGPENAVSGRTARAHIRAKGSGRARGFDALREAVNALAADEVAETVFGRTHPPRDRAHADRIVVSALMAKFPSCSFRYEPIAGLHLQSCAMCRRPLHPAENIGIGPMLHPASGFVRSVVMCAKCFPAVLRNAFERRACAVCKRLMYVAPNSGRRYCLTRCGVAAYYAAHRSKCIARDRERRLARAVGKRLPPDAGDLVKRLPR